MSSACQFRGIAAFYDGAGTDQTKIHLYNNNQEGNVAVQFRNEKTDDDSTPPKAFTSDKDGFSQVGPIIDASKLASTKFNNMELVFAMTRPHVLSEAKAATHGPSCSCHCDDPPPGVNVSLVAPVFKCISTTTEPFMSVAACTNNDETWVYYISKKTTGDTRPQLFTSTVKQAGKGQCVGMQGVTHQETWLGAYFVGKDGTLGTRFVVYQNSENQLAECTIVGKQASDARIQNAFAKPGSSFAVVNVGDVIYLYYVDAQGNLIRNTKTNGNWGSGTTVNNATYEPKDGAQLTVVYNNDAKTNHIFYASDGGEAEYEHVIDDLN